LLAAEVGSGAHRVEVELGGLAPGLYVYRFQSAAGTMAGTLAKLRGGASGTPSVRLAAGEGSPVSFSAGSVLRIVRFEARKTGFNTLIEDRDVEDGATVQFMLEPSGSGADNHAPAVTPIDNIAMEEGATRAISVLSSDVDGNPIDLTASVVGAGGGAAPAGFFTFVDNSDGTGVLQVTPGPGEAGTYTASVVASDGELDFVESFLVIVTAVGGNAPPVLEAIANQTVTEGVSLNIDVAASDADGDPITLTAEVSGDGGVAAFATLDDQGDGTGVLTVSPIPGDAGAYVAVITASDGADSSTETFSITVLSASSNNPPAVSPIPAKQVAEGETLQFDVAASDPDGDPVTIEAAVVDDNGFAMGTAFYNFRDNQDGTGTFKFTPDSGEFGDYTVTVTASDGALDATATFTLTVIAPGGNSAPVVADIGDKAVVEGNTLEVEVSATDINGDPIALSVEIAAEGGGNVGAGFFDFVDAGDGTGTLTVTPDNGDAGSYTATVTASDGIASGEKSFSITVLEPGGGGGMIPLTDMGAQTYLGFSGGLYPNASNTMPAAHHAAGVDIANSIEPLDTNGNPSANGKYVLVSVGMSNTTQEFCSQDTELPCDDWTFMGQAADDPAVNTSNLVIVNGAKGGQAADDWESSSSDNYTRIKNEKLAAQGLSAAQVQIAWVKVANRQPTVGLPSASADAYRLMGQNADIARALKFHFPNLKMVFFSSRIYAGYATTILNPEPYAYESAFGVKWVVEAQIDQMSGGGVDPFAGDVDYDEVAWFGWGAYFWADGLNPRSDGLIWERNDLESDGTHPSPSGEEKVGALLLDFFKNSPQTKCWFLENGVCE
jgi:hypothetical protein